MGTRREMFVIVIRWTYQLFFVSGDFFSFLIIFTNSGYRKSAEKENNHDFWYSEIEWLTDFCCDTRIFGKQTTTFKFLRVGTLKYRINFENTFNKLLAGENILDSLTVVRYMIFNLSLLTLAWCWRIRFLYSLDGKYIVFVSMHKSELKNFWIFFSDFWAERKRDYGA